MPPAALEEADGPTLADGIRLAVRHLSCLPLHGGYRVLRPKVPAPGPLAEPGVGSAFAHPARCRGRPAEPAGRSGRDGPEVRGRRPAGRGGRLPRPGRHRSRSGPGAGAGRPGAGARRGPCAARELARPGGFHRTRARGIAERLMGVTLGAAQDEALHVWGAVYGQTSHTLHGGAADPARAARLYAEVLAAARELLVPLAGRAARVLELTVLEHPMAGRCCRAGAVGGPARERLLLPLRPGCGVA